MTLEHVTTHVEDAADKVLFSLDDAATAQAFLAAFVKQIQLLEDAAWSVLMDKWLDTAEGAQLDNLGRIVGQPRGGFDDATYRRWLAARILLNRTSGTIPEILQIAEQVVDAPGVTHVYDRWPAAIEISIRDGVQPYGAAIASILLKAVAAGVNVIVTWYETEPVFAFDGYAEAGGFDYGRWVKSRTL